ncbi:MAG: aminopeptidase P family protein [Deltaproteobacteria bacterium]|nr:aminopeptidase P family protein [Deltaproteobacteria bacterium]
MQIAIEPITVPPSTAEMQLRLDKVRALMAREGLDYYVAAQGDNLYYLTNFACMPQERPFFLVIPFDDTPVYIVPALEKESSRSNVMPEIEICNYYDFPAPAGRTYIDALNNTIQSGKKVGIESSLSISRQAVIPGRQTVVDIVDEARLIKSDYEIGRIAYASLLANDGLAKTLEVSRPGTQQITVYTTSVQQMMGRVLTDIPDTNLLVTKFLSAVWPNELSAMPHSHPGIFVTLEPGGPNVCIVTTQANGYSAELERTFFIGNIPEASKEPFDTAMEARALAYELIKPGVAVADVDEAVQGIIKKRGYGDYILHRTGHGFGITGHEPPWIALGSDEVLEKNMVISIEPGIYIPGQGGYRHSDTVLITPDGCISLTSWPDKLEDLILPA